MATTDRSGSDTVHVAVLLAAYNGEKYIGEQIKSILDQTYRNLTVYIHDDGSTDGTLQAVSQLMDGLEEERRARIVILDGPATGSAKANFLWMLSQVEADIYAFSDQDDVWIEDKLEQEMALLSREAETEENLPVCVFSDMYVADEALGVRSDSFIRDLGRSADRTAYSQIMIDNPAAGCTMLFNRALRDIVLSADIDITQIEMHDQYILALAALCGRVKAVPKPLVYYRQHGTNVMGAKEEESRAAKVMRNVSLFASGEFAREKAAFHRKERVLAAQLLKADAVPEDKKKILRELAEIDSKGKLQRMAFYRKNDFSRLSGNLWMRLWV